MVPGDILRKVMLTAESAGMTKGDWAFIDVAPCKADLMWGDRSWQRNDSFDDTAKRAYKAMLRISSLEPAPEVYENFAADVRKRAKEDYNYT